MKGFRVEPDDLSSRLTRLESNVRTLEFERNALTKVTIGGIPQNNVPLAPASAQSYYAFGCNPIGDYVTFSGTFWNTRNRYDFDSNWTGGSHAWEIRYYQDTPLVYTLSQVAGGTDYVVLASGTTTYTVGVNSLDFTYTAPISSVVPYIQGTFGTIRLWFTPANAASTSGGGQNLGAFCTLKSCEFTSA